MSRISAITAVMSNIVYVIPFTWYIESMSLKRCHKVDMCEEQESLIEAVLKLKMSPELKVSELLPFYNKSLRTLENQFQNNIGVSPKAIPKNCTFKKCK